MKKKKFKFSHLYLGLVMAITYLPLIMVVIFSFNDSKLTVSWKGFTLSWYQELFHDGPDRSAEKQSDPGRRELPGGRCHRHSGSHRNGESQL